MIMQMAQAMGCQTGDFLILSSDIMKLMDTSM